MNETVTKLGDIFPQTATSKGFPIISIPYPSDLPIPFPIPQTPLPKFSKKLGNINIEDTGWTPPDRWNSGGGTRFPYGTPTSGGGNFPPIFVPTTGVNTTLPIVPTNDNCACFAGSVIINADGSCGCTQPNQEVPSNTTKVIDAKNGQIIYYQLPNAAFNLGAFITDNPLLVGGGILAIIFLATRKGR